MLAILAARAGSVVSIAHLIEQLWRDDPPQRPRDTLYSYLSRLRKIFAETAVSIRRRSGGYLLEAEPATVDMNRFRELVSRARAGGDLADWDAAMRLWRGEPFAELDVPELDNLRTTLDAERLTAVLDHNDALLDHGEHARVLPRLRDLAEQYPWDERLAGQLMLALYRCGRPSEALDHYRLLSTRLVKQRGTEPGAELSRLHRRILAEEPDGDGSRSTAAGPGGAARTVSVPRQLPGDIPGFTGRVAQLRRLDDLLAARTRTVAITAITGTAGIGKTALAVHWAHEVGDQFPDGQLYVNLRGFDPSGRVVTPQEAIRGFLDGLGVSRDRIPTDFAAQAALFRSLVADRRILVVLDNTRDAEQVRSLLPGGEGCLALVTSRNSLAGLVVSDAATPLVVDTMPVEDCRALLANRVGDDRIADIATVDELIDACARLPLALCVVAARAATTPELTLAKLIAELRDERSTLDSLDAGDEVANVRAVFSWSYRALSPEAARLFRLLGLYPGQAVSVAAAASLTGDSEQRAESLLTELASAHLVERHSPGRHSFHDLLRVYALELAGHEDGEANRREATRRLLDHFLRTAFTANRLIDPGRDTIDIVEPVAAVTIERLTGYDDAMAWFRSIHSTMEPIVELAFDGGFDAHTYQLAWTFGNFLDWHGHWNDLVKVQRLGLRAAQRLRNRTEQARGQRDLGRAFSKLRRYDEAERHLREALRLAEAVGARGVQSSSLTGFSTMYNRVGRHAEALEMSMRALKLYRADGHARGEATALNNIGWTYARLEDYPRAIAYCEKALELHTEIGHEFGQATCWDSLGYAHHGLGDHDKAVECYLRSVELAERGGGERTHLSRGLMRLAEAYLALGDPAAAMERLRQALAILDELGHPEADEVRAELNRLGGGTDDHVPAATSGGEPR